MVNSINLIAFGTFGNPNGFKQTFFVGSKELAKSVKAFDLNTNAIKLFANSKVYAIRKEYANGFKTVAYSVYSYAKEHNSDRSGTFIGSSILYTDKIAKEHITIAQLNEFHNQLVTKNVFNDLISVNHSDKFVVVKPKDFDKIEFHLREIEIPNFRHNTGNYLVVFCNINDNYLSKFLKDSIDLLNVYDAIYFTDSQEVAEFVHQKGVYKLVQNVGEKRDFEREVNILIEERKLQREQSISEFSKEVQRINDEKNRTIKEFKSQIEQGEKIHLENNRRLKESKEDILRIEQYYDDFMNKTKGLIYQLRHNSGKLEEVKQVHNTNKILFNNGINDLKTPLYTTFITKPKPKGNLQTEHQHHDIEHKTGLSRGKEREELDENVNKFDIFKVISLVLSFLLIITWVYFLFFKSNSSSKISLIQYQEKVNTIPQDHVQESAEIVVTEDLKPKANSFLNENDYIIVFKKLKTNMKLEDVVKIIYTLNPTEIGSIYIGQEAIYSKHILELNDQCFEKKDGIYYFAKDTIKQIPSYKK